MTSEYSHVSTLSYLSGRLHFAGIPLDELAARFGTPLYVYNLDLACLRATQLQESLASTDHLICYAVKANTSQKLISKFAALGLGADVVSAGELLCARRAGVPASKIVFSGVAKTSDEIALAVKEDILSFNVESPGEIERIRSAAKSQNKKARLAFRINPDIDAKTHPKIATGLHATKFGLETSTALKLAEEILGDPYLELTGLSCHIGSQILDLGPLKESAVLVRSFTERIRALGHRITQIDLGGGLGVAYHPSEVAKAPSLKSYGAMISEAMKGESARVILEPGRALVAEAGVLLARVIETKETGGKIFVMVDAGMNDLVRPAMYDAYHEIVPLWKKRGAEEMTVDIVGPVCETGDYFAFDRKLSKVQEGDMLAIKHAGAYGYSMASHYNLRPKPAEVGIFSGKIELLRPRESIEDILR